MHEPTNGTQRLPSCFSSERYDGYNDPKKYKSDHNLCERNKNKKGRFSICVHKQIWGKKKSDRTKGARHRRNATCSRHILSQFNGYEPFLVIPGISSWLEFRSATNIDRLLLFSTLSTPTFTLLGNDCRSCHTNFRPKLCPKIGNFEFSPDISARWSRTQKLFGPARTLYFLCSGQWLQFSSPNLLWLTRYEYKNLFRIRFLGRSVKVQQSVIR